MNSESCILKAVYYTLDTNLSGDLEGQNKYGEFQVNAINIEQDATQEDIDAKIKWEVERDDRKDWDTDYCLSHVDIKVYMPLLYYLLW